MRGIVLPPLDLLAHNLAAVLAAIVLVMVFSQIVSSAIQRASRLFLQASVFDALTDEEREAMRRRVRRRSLITVALLSLALLVAGVAGSFLGVRALDVLRSALGGMGDGDPSLIRQGLAGVAGIVAAALVLDVLVRAVVATLGKALARSVWFAARREPLLDAVERLRAAARTGILCGAVVLCVRALAVPIWLLRVVTVGSYALAAFYGSRAATAIAYIVVDLFFDGSGKLTRLESPLRYLGSLKHLTGITKRTVDYFVYVGAATLVADELTPDTWISRAGHIGIRIIIIFYTSRVLVELSILFLKEIFLGKDVEEDQVALQRRQTLVPVAGGFLRYGIYFAALVMVLRAAEIDPTPLLAGAGVVGVAIGLGAQAFVGDIVAGFFILFEDLILVGDLDRGRLREGTRGGDGRAAHQDPHRRRRALRHPQRRGPEGGEPLEGLRQRGGRRPRALRGGPAGRARSPPVGRGEGPPGGDRQAQRGRGQGPGAARGGRRAPRARAGRPRPGRGSLRRDPRPHRRGAARRRRRRPASAPRRDHRQRAPRRRARVQGQGQRGRGVGAAQAVRGAQGGVTPHAEPRLGRHSRSTQSPVIAASNTTSHCSQISLGCSLSARGRTRCSRSNDASDPSI
ncbi:MAG: mechanosensitive ion channel [Minicystis sp.]